MKILKKKNNMYSTIFKTILLTLLTITLFNCNKDDDSMQPEQNIRLKTYAINEYEYDFIYNDLGKITNFSTPSGNHSIIYNEDGQIIQNGTESYTYNSQGEISKISSSTNNITIVYNNKGLIATMVQDTGIHIFHTSFEYDSNDKLIETVLKGPPVTGYYRNKFVYDEKENIVQRVFESGSGDGVNYSKKSTYNFVFDNKKNPNYNLLSKTGITDALTFIRIAYSGRSIEVSGILFYYNKNNLLSSQSVHSNGSSSSREYSYVYDKNDYPISAELASINTTGESSTTYYKWTYETY
ncbi:hypothetical protein Q4Q34_10665 [Flavivirga abyssicola]|uniref:hypothetical protein n=1 Tax=Flavivirga abyssicola TaxID=3063533 RepID=UPI0026DEE381|nr:hypothetical protein [Flavivirga sp. MEBiC07777]WVK11687.1 hypothetical protein Q4Q34_10665 [Flavivirga sp. MEBiC07777]